MKHVKIPVGSNAYLYTYLLDESPEIACSKQRPCVIVCPGGAYAYTSDREAEPVALAFAARGFHACVLRYACAPARFPEALCSLAQSVALLRDRAESYCIDPRAISVCGFSAGGHLAASLGVFWEEDFLANLTGEEPRMMRPDKMVLCYPVITGGAFAHKGSIDNLLGADADEQRRAVVSLEQRVTRSTPPTFLWHTATDDAVPVENSLLFAGALRTAGVPFELHIYPTGGHGLALASPLTSADAVRGRDIRPKCAGWIDLAAAFLKD